MAHLYAGRKVLVKVDLNDIGGPTASWLIVAQQDDGGLNCDTEKVDGRTKDDLGLPNDVITGISWSISFGGKLDSGDPAYLFLWNKWHSQAKVWLQIDKSLVGGQKREGQAILKLSEKFANNGLVEYTCDATGQGNLVTSSA